MFEPIQPSSFGQPAVSSPSFGSGFHFTSINFGTQSKPIDLTTDDASTASDDSIDIDEEYGIPKRKVTVIEDHADNCDVSEPRSEDSESDSDDRDFVVPDGEGEESGEHDDSDESFDPASPREGTPFNDECLHCGSDDLVVTFKDHPACFKCLKWRLAQLCDPNNELPEREGRNALLCDMALAVSRFRSVV